MDWCLLPSSSLSGSWMRWHFYFSFERLMTDQKRKIDSTRDNRRESQSTATCGDLHQIKSKPNKKKSFSQLHSTMKDLNKICDEKMLSLLFSEKCMAFLWINFFVIFHFVFVVHCLPRKHILRTRIDYCTSRDWLDMIVPLSMDFDCDWYFIVKLMFSCFIFLCLFHMYF